MGRSAGTSQPPRAGQPARRPLLRPPRTADPNRRLRFGLLVALFVLSLFAGRLIQLQGLDASALAAQALAQRSKTVPLPAHRGDIRDDNGAVLATTVERENITVDQTVVGAYGLHPGNPSRRNGVRGAAAALAPILRLPVAELVRRLTGTKRFAYIVKDIEPDVWRQVSALQIPGIYPEAASRRIYPGRDVAANVIGFLGRDGTPLAGVERARRSDLAGTDGVLRYEQGRDGRQIPTGMTSEVDPQPGHAVQLTIDQDLQWKTQQALAAQVRQTRSQSGYAVALDVRTGDVLALATVPTFDANAYARAAPATLQDGALTDVFEPGSTAKGITAAAALQEGVATPQTRFTVPNTLQRGGKTFHDAETHGTEKLTLAGVLAKSSNIGAIMTGERLSPQVMYRYQTLFGLGQPTGIGLAESRGILAPASDWSGSQRYTVLFGQGLSVTALQAAEVFATVANGGVRLMPRLVKAVADDKGELVPTPAPGRTRVISPQAAAALRLMLEGVVGDDGTAAAASIPGYRVAGKTGTAQRYDDRAGGYSGYTASFIGMAPADAPRLVVAVILQNPTNGHFGGTVAAPVFKQVMTYALAARGVAPSGTGKPALPITWR